MILFFIILHITGFIMSIQAVMQSRSEQGASAWAISLNTVPLFAVPAWIVFGDSDFDYAAARTAGLEKVRPIAERLIENLEKAEASTASNHPTMEILEKVASLPTMRGNHADLLVDGKNTFKSIFDAVEQAQNYVLVQFFSIRDDGLGRDLRDLLIRKSREGVRVFVLTDDVGSWGLPDSYLAELHDAGIKAGRFMDQEGGATRFQLNYRNHRKIVVIDGKIAFLGGHNLGDEYLGKHPRLTPWRDSHMRLTGPIVKAVQIPFVEDWHWSTGDLLDDLDWDIGPDDFTGEMEAICLPSGPADPIETCSLFFLTAINNARERVWLASPYFVPDDKIVNALQLAAIRGVDVRVLMPSIIDNQMVHYSSFSYLEPMDQAGVKTYRYLDGFMHQKVVLIDDDIAAIGSANLDNRSFRLNFEVTGIVHDKAFAAEVEEMLLEDLKKCEPATKEDYLDKNFYFRLKVRLARLLSPIQ
tara:strand:+ start:3718 stop:5130 length:1413 start_codon:yes stop_codon:yes gene_type:complete